MPAAGDQAPIDAFFGRFFVDVIRQRNIAFAEVENFFFIDNDGAEFMYRAGNIIFKITILREHDENRSCSYCFE